MLACGFVRNASYDSDYGCGTIPVVVVAHAGTANATGTITAANCLAPFCPRGAMTIGASWVATSGFAPVIPSGVPRARRRLLNGG